MKALTGLVGLLAVAGLATTAWAGDTFVKGHTRKDGTYVAPHYRSAPDSSYNNNWSTSPNINPHTGQQGTNQPRLYDNNSSGGYGGSGFGGTQQRSRSRY